MKYSFLVDTYDTERIKILSVWSEFHDEDMSVRPREDDPRGRSVHEQMVHQCVSEDNWMKKMLCVLLVAMSGCYYQGYAVRQVGVTINQNALSFGAMAVSLVGAVVLLAIVVLIRFLPQGLFAARVRS